MKRSLSKLFSWWRSRTLRDPLTTREAPHRDATEALPFHDAAPASSHGDGRLHSMGGPTEGLTELEGQTVGAARATLGDFELIRELGRGGMGVVHLARDPRLDRLVALKILPNVFGDDEGARLRFQREAELVSRLEHPSLASVLDVGTTDGVPWIAMRYVRGRTLTAALAAERNTLFPTFREAAAFVAQLARALESAHAVGIVHRDLKPGNIMVTPEGLPVVLDFGLARDLDSKGGGPTLSGDVIGTPAYMAPEQIMGAAHRADARLDVWALGVLLHELLTGERPFEGASRDALYHAILQDDPSLTAGKRRAWPRDLEVVIRTALEKDPHRRYATAEDLARDLQAVCDGESIRARPPHPLLKVVRTAKKHPVIATWAIVLLVGGPYLATVLTGRAKDQERIDRNAALQCAAMEQALARGDIQAADRLLVQLQSMEVGGCDLGAGQAALRRLRILERIETLVLDDELDPYGDLTEAEIDEASISLGQDPRLVILRVVAAVRRGDEARAQNILNSEAPSEWPALDALRGATAEGVEEHHEVALLRALLAVADGNPRLAFERLARLLEARPDAASLAWLTAESLTRLQDYEGALGFAGRAQALVEGFGPRRKARYGVHLRRAGLVDEALAITRRASTAAPNDEVISVHLVNALADAGLEEEALKVCRALLEDAPQSLLAWTALGNLYFEAKDYAQAEPAFRKVYGAHPTDQAAILGLANALIEQKRPEEAVVVLEPALQAEPNFPYGWNTLANAKRHMGLLDEAMAACERALEMAPEYGNAHGTQGAILHAKGRTRSAERAYRRALELDPDLGPALWNLAVLRHRRDPDESIALYRRLLKISPDDVDVLINLSNSLSKDTETIEEAAAMARRATELAPDSVLAWNNYATALSDLGRVEEAIPALRRVLGIEPDRREGHANLMMLLADRDPMVAYAHAILLVESDEAYLLSAEGNRLKLREAVADEDADHPLAKLAAHCVLHVREPGQDLNLDPEGLAHLRLAVEKLPEGKVGDGDWAIKQAAQALLVRGAERARRASDAQGGENAPR